MDNPNCSIRSYVKVVKSRSWSGLIILTEINDRINITCDQKKTSFFKNNGWGH